MFRLRSWYDVICCVAVLVLFTVKCISSQSEPLFNEDTTTVTTTTVDVQEESKNISRQLRSNVKADNLDDINMDESDKTAQPENIVTKVEPLRRIESASKVQNQPLNDNNIKSKTNLNKVVENLDTDILQKIIKSRLAEKAESAAAKRANIRAHVRYDEVTGELVEGDHPCHRDCLEGGEPMICYYHFNLEWYQTMSKACYGCPYNASHCSLPDCIPADGISRALNVINRKMPGPAIEVCQNDRIIVDVENDLMTEATTVHWHGQHQRGTPYMDGTPMVTQCPIPPETTFRYQFNATHSGTHFWHSHSGMQRADGAAGALIIRKPKSQDSHARLYDYDRSDHVMIVTDWIHELAVSMFTDHHHSKGDNKPPTLLINGLGRFKVFHQNTTDKNFYMRGARFNVEQGYKYRFRVINAEFLNCPIEMSVDGHNITIVATDGYDLEPITATSLVTYAGERYDFVLEANNEIDNYWIRFRGLMDCDEVLVIGTRHITFILRFTKAKQVAVLHYEGAMEDEPAGDLTWEESHNEGLQLNALNKGEEENETLSVAEMRSLAGPDDSLKPIADYQFYVAYDFYAKNNSHYHREPYYGYYQVPHKANRLYTPQLNHISMKMPTSPLLIAKPSSENFCNASSIDPSCQEGYCECPHILSVRLGSVVEIIIVDEGVTFDANHPFHLHGHAFRVVAMRRLANQTTIEEVKEFDKAGLLKRNLKNAPLKDTVTVPDGGYTVVRFKADNPGYWLFHCHIEFHVEVGMALVFKVGEHKDMAPIPPDFPTCGNYMPDNMLEHATTERPRPQNNSVISITHWWPVVVVDSNNAGNCISVSFGLQIVIALAILSLGVGFT